MATASYSAGDRLSGENAMDARQIETVRQSFAAVAPSASAVAAAFYRRLFELDPPLRAMFRGDLERQGEKLMQAIGFAVGGLHRAESLVPVLRHLGGRHVACGVREEHYDTVGAALLDTLSAGLGEAFTDEVRSAWTAAYGLLAGEMKAGARAHVALAEAAPMA
jgi:hemoglobin-like flavoprotein